jgi:LAO/AO transport system kinase
MSETPTTSVGVRLVPLPFIKLLADFDAMKPAALARAVSIVENHREGWDALLAHFNPRLGRARRVGITGPPGAGKSTLTTLVALAYRAQGFRVGIIAVDPTSPFTGGALLGDRIRMEAIAGDPGVFIRSMATRGSLGGLATATREACDVFDAFGVDIILIETVGVGQSELDIAKAADTTLVVLVPESGDSIQTLKAGVMEIADVYAVNKADRPGADRLRKDIELMLTMRAKSLPNASTGHDDGSAWRPPVLRTTAATGEGIEQLVSAIDKHFAHLNRSGQLRERRRQRMRERVMEIVDLQLRQRLWRDPATLAWLEAQLPELEIGTVAPFAIADALRQRSAALLVR